VTEHENNLICERVQLNLSLQSEGELLSAEEERQIAEHLPGCEKCRVFVKALAPLNEALTTHAGTVRAIRPEQDALTARRLAGRAMKTVRRGRRRRIVPYVLVAAKAAAIVIVAATAYYVGSQQPKDPRVLAVLLKDAVTADSPDVKSVTVALRWSQFARSLGDREQITNAGTALHYAVERVGGDVTVGQDRDLVAPIMWDLGKELFLLGYYNQDHEAEGNFYRSAESVWLQAARRHRPPPEVWMGLANCCKAHKTWGKAKEYLESMLDDPNLNAHDRARGANFLAWVLTKHVEELKDPSSPRHGAWLTDAESNARKAIELTGGKYAKAYANLYLVLSLQAEHEKDAGRKTALQAAAAKALDDGVETANRKLSAPGFKKSTRLWFTLAILRAYQGREKDALEAFRKARAHETRNFVASIWAAKSEPAFKRLSDSARKRLDRECEKSEYKFYAPATMSVVWDEEFLTESTGFIYN